MKLIIAVIGIAASSSAFAQDGPCGAVPSLPTAIESSESIKGQLQGQANLLTKYIGNTQLGGEIQAARKNIYQSSDKFFAAQQDAYLAYLFCLALSQDRNLSTVDKLKAISEFRKPAPIKQAGTVRQIDNRYLEDRSSPWNFRAPAGAIIEAIGLNCPATVSAGGVSFPIRDNTKVPVPGLDGQEIEVSVSFGQIGAGMQMPPVIGSSSVSCRGKFLVTAAD